MLNKKKSRLDESILVCVYYGPNGERLIRRAVQSPKYLIARFIF